MSGHTDFAENMKRIKELRKFLQDELNKILDAPDKRELSPSDICKRLNGYLKYQIDDEAVSHTPLISFRLKMTKSTLKIFILHISKITSHQCNC